MSPPKERWPYPFPSIWGWLRYHLAWKGWSVTLPNNRALLGAGDTEWKLHRCADGQQCRASIPGGCAGSWCGHFDVKPYGGGYGDPRLPLGKLIPIRCSSSR